MKKYIFFIREYNDWDNIAPIIYYLSKNSHSKICICFYRKDLRNNDIYKYIQERAGKNLEVFFCKEKKLTTIANFAITIINKVLRIFKFGIQYKTNENVPKKLLKNWFNTMNLKKYSKVICIFDRTLNPVLETVYDEMKGFNSIFVSCPHGPMTNVNRMMYKNQIKILNNFESLRVENKEELNKFFQFFNYIVFTDHLELNFNKIYCLPIEGDNENKSKIKVLGSIRYCKEWLTHIENFTTKFLKKKKDNIKIVFFMKKFQHNVFKNEIYRTIKIFTMFPNIDFYIKPHTRGMKFSSKYSAPNIHIDYDSSSSFLINMADVIFFHGGTSIILEALAKKKLIVCLDYLDSNINIYDHYDACQVLRCIDDLCFFLSSDIPNKIKNNKYSGENVLKQIVYSGRNSVSVPDEYINFFNNL